MVINALSRTMEISDEKWVVTITADVNDSDYVYEIREYNNAEFLSEGFAISILISKLTRFAHIFEKFDWDEDHEDLLLDFMPKDSQGPAHTFIKVEVTGPDCRLNLDGISDEEAREIIREFILRGILDYCDEEADEILNDIFKNRKLSMKPNLED